MLTDIIVINTISKTIRHIFKIFVLKFMAEVIKDYMYFYILKPYQNQK